MALVWLSGAQPSLGPALASGSSKSLGPGSRVGLGAGTPKAGRPAVSRKGLAEAAWAPAWPDPGAARGPPVSGCSSP